MLQCDSLLNFASECTQMKWGYYLSSNRIPYWGSNLCTRSETSFTKLGYIYPGIRRSNAVTFPQIRGIAEQKLLFSTIVEIRHKTWWWNILDCSEILIILNVVVSKHAHMRTQIVCKTFSLQLLDFIIQLYLYFLLFYWRMHILRSCILCFTFFCCLRSGNFISYHHFLHTSISIQSPSPTDVLSGDQ